MTKQKTHNTLYTNDNLYVLSGLNSNLVDLIYLDPPFNTKRTYSALVGSKAAGASFKDMWTWKDVDEYYLDTLADNFPVLAKYIADVGAIHSKAMMAYLTYMAQRIIEMYRILKETGSLYLHCDPTASHYLKSLLDGIFGKNNFRNEIIWHRNETWKKYSGKRYDVATDHILYYTKTNDYTYIPQYIQSPKDPSGSYNRIDSEGRYYREVLITGHKSLGQTSKGMYEYKGYTPEYGWTVDKKKLMELDEQKLLIWRNGVCKNYKKYLNERTERVNSAWYDIVSARGKERTGYPTQKPLALLKRIILASSNEGDLVMDPFCGCATTCVAAQQLGRKWIGIDIEKQSVNILIERLSDDAGLFKDFVATVQVPKRSDVKEEQPSMSIKQRLYKEQDGKCKSCGQNIELWNLEIDHIIPKSRGGGDYYENYQLLCGNCNRTKGDRPMAYLRMKIETREKMMKNKIFFGE